MIYAVFSDDLACKSCFAGILSGSGDKKQLWKMI
jgi:hypothetical protein